MIIKELDRCIGHSEKLLLRGDQRKEFLSLADVISKRSAKGNDICFVYIPCIHRTGFCTSAAVVTFLCIDHQLVILKGDSVFSAGLFTDTTVDTCILFPADLSRSLDPYIILLCLQTVVLASGNTEFEFMRKLSSEISFI